MSQCWIERLLGENGGRFASCWAPTCIPPSPGASHSNPKLGQMKAVVQVHLAHHKEMPISKVAQVSVAACVTKAKEPYTTSPVTHDWVSPCSKNLLLTGALRRTNCLHHILWVWIKIRWKKHAWLIKLPHLGVTEPSAQKKIQHFLSTRLVWIWKTV